MKVRDVFPSGWKGEREATGVLPSVLLAKGPCSAADSLQEVILDHGRK